RRVVDAGIVQVDGPVLAADVAAPFGRLAAEVDAHAAAAGEVLRQIAGPIVLPPSPLGAAALDRLPFTADRVRDTGHAGEQGRRAHLGLGRTVVLDDPARPRGAVGAALQSAGAALLA